MDSTARCVMRSIALVLILALTWNGLAHAAQPLRRLAALQSTATPNSAPAPASPSQAVPVSTPAFPIHDRLLAAHTVFLAQPTLEAHFAASPNTTYNAVLDALDQWGRFRVVPDAAQADLVLQLHGVVTEVTGNGTPPDYIASVIYLSTLRLTAADPHTLAPLWQAEAPLQVGGSRKTRALQMGTTGRIIVSDLKLATGDPLDRQDQAAIKSLRTAHTRALVITAVSIGALAGLTVLAIHLARSNAASFCQQHNLNPCPGA